MSPVPPESATASRTRKPASGVVVPETARWHGRLAAYLVWIVVRLVAASLRWRWTDRSGMLVPEDSRRMIFAIWHNRLFLSLVLYQKGIGSRKPGRQLAAIVSASRDGGLLAHVLKLFKVVGIRGSSSRRGAQALRELKSAAEMGLDLAVTPDGPRGPKYDPHPGVIALGQMTQLPIVPVSYRLGWKWTLKSWDNFQIPIPFSVVEVELGETIEVPPDSGEVEREILRSRLRAVLNSMTRD